MVIRNTFEFMLWLFHSATDVVNLHSFAEDHLVSHCFCGAFVSVFMCVIQVVNVICILI